MVTHGLHRACSTEYCVRNCILERLLGRALLPKKYKHTCRGVMAPNQLALVALCYVVAVAWYCVFFCHLAVYGVFVPEIQGIHTTKSLAQRFPCQNLI